MKKNEEALYYLASFFPKNNLLSISRLIKTLYLSDWKSAIYFKQQITDIEWEIYYSGPYSDSFEDLIYKNGIFELSKEYVPGCGKINIVNLHDKNLPICMAANPKFIMDSVLTTTGNLDWYSFLDIVYSTYPIAMKDRYIKIDLVKLAEEYRYVKRSIVFA